MEFDLRPRKIDVYIVRKFITTFFVALLLIIGIVIIFDISEKIDNFVSKEAPLKAIVFDYYVNFVPYFMNMFSPLFVFITVIFFTSKMAADSEIIAILSCGISFHRMMVPYIFSAALIAILSLCLNLFIIPEANKTRLDFEDKYVKARFASVGRNVHYQTSPGEFVFAESFSSWNKTAYRFTIEKIEDGLWNIIGNVSLDELERELDITLPADEYDTFSGMIFDALESIPDDGSTFELETNGLSISVTEVEDHQIKRAFVRILEKSDDDEDGDKNADNDD